MKGKAKPACRVVSGAGRRELSALSRRDEKALYAILTDPVKWGELFLRNRDGSPRRYWDHQKDDLRCRSRNIIHQSLSPRKRGTGSSGWGLIPAIPMIRLK